MRDNRLIEMRVFKAVAEFGSFTEAAHTLSVTQPFVSRTIKSLEARLGITLLRRSTRHLSLTLEGERFLASTNKLLSELSAIEADTSGWQSSINGPIGITAPTNLGIDQIAPYYRAFSKYIPT
ncbi:LysR family transcriptional regulator [Kineobactrum salinum]|uniref:LysR family transcriptional regulator n=1 Tax=Kineobactrum salinum TaxID=2708301 RepID=UPI0018D8228B|nr:LysR family transcriptional regulator [Kineobactrum salinum]